MSDDLFAATERALSRALELLRNASPRNLEEAMEVAARFNDIVLPRAPLSVLVAHLRECGPNDLSLHNLTLAVQSWDHDDSDWASGTAAHSPERRQLILGRLGFTDQQQQIINDRVPRFTDTDLPTVIAEEHQEWYKERKKTIRDFYWDQYVRQLLPPRGKWTREAVSVLDLSTDDVVERLSDPTRSAIYPVKGLVMGYVQSGKTSHFSGLIAKAADAGYRLIIVLAGTLDLLRRQTQRRIDKEIVGVELLGKEEYGHDSDWNQFVSHGGLPSQMGAFDWERLTNKDDDYKTLSKHLTVLEFRPSERAKPFNHPDNLRTASAKLAVIKKVPSRLNKLCDDLEKLRELRSRLEHVPTLVIDDESDQASINTVDQSKPGKNGTRTGTNQAIVRLLSLLPRAQYVGYTATPFANVFIDPDDAADLFPKDFIVSLPRPSGYMGVADFFDFGKEFDKQDYRGNKNAFVRAVEGDNKAPENLPKAIDSFVLAGAIKLFREAADPDRFGFRHHTMLVHHSAAQVVHESDRELVADIFRDGARYQTKAGSDALRNLFEKDFAQVSAVRAASDPFPRSFDELRHYISLCLTRICSGKAVRIVNGEGRNRDDTPDFDASPVWAILVGGTKLSRGYTVEGLTVSYYRRPAGAGDTLMQMGRWFGFRAGYQDLVRLFVGRKEPKGRSVIDLYEAFRALCLDEEALRGDLRKYALEGIKPRQVPPLVRQHLPQLPPTARNKMFNAEIKSRDFAGEWTEKTLAPTETALARKNREALESLLNSMQLGSPERVEFRNRDGEKRAFSAYFGVADGADVLTFLRAYKWAEGKQPVALETSYIEDELSHGGNLSRWHLVIPQASALKKTETLGRARVPISIIERSRVSTTRFGVYSEPRHRDAAEALAGRQPIDEETDVLSPRMKSPGPVLVLYLVRDRNDPESGVSVGFGIQYPGQKRSRAIEWSVRDRSQESSVVVNV